MLRAGLSHLEAALIINNPHMQMSKFSSKSFYWKKVLGKNPLGVQADAVTTDMLIKALMNPFELNQIEDQQIAAMCYRILKQNEAMEYLQNISRADSPNGSIANTYAKARVQMYEVDLFQAKMGQRDFPFLRINEALSNNAINPAASEDEIREQMKAQPMAFLHGMYALGIHSFQDLVAPYFFGARKNFDERIVKPILYNLQESLSKDKKAQVVDNIYKSYITYMLSGSSLFGNEDGTSMRSKRDYYLETFPDDYMKTIQENAEIRDLLKNFLQVKQFGNRKRIVLQDVGSLSKDQKNEIKRRLEMLVYSDDKDARKMAEDLFIYSYFDNGLQFTHDSFSSLFSTQFLASFPIYNETLQGLDEELTKDEEENFIAQFLLTYNDAAYNVDSIIEEGNVVDDTITVDLNDYKMRKNMINEVTSPNPNSTGINVYPYIKYKGDIYILDKDMFDEYPGKPVYHKVEQYATYPRLPLFSRQMSVIQLAQEFPKTEQSNPGGDYYDMPDGPYAPDFSSDDPMLQEAQASFDAMPYDFIDDSVFDAVENGDNMSTGDVYAQEGENELREPMC